MRTDIAARLASAIESGDFEAAQPLVLEYGAAVREQLRAAGSPRERQKIFDEAIQTLNAHLLHTRVTRSHIAARLRQLSGESLYQGQQLQLHTWRLDA